MNLCHAAALNFISFILGGSAGVEEGRVSTLPLGPHMAVVTDPSLPCLRLCWGHEHLCSCAYLVHLHAHYSSCITADLPFCISLCNGPALKGHVAHVCCCLQLLKELVYCKPRLLEALVAQSILGALLIWGSDSARVTRIS